jgi:hypothetical protein
VSGGGAACLVAALTATVVVAMLTVGAQPALARDRGACFGGLPQTFIAHEPEPQVLAVAGGFLYWRAGANLRRAQLPNGKVSTVDEGFAMGLHVGPIDDRGVLVLDGQSRLSIFDLRARAFRALASGKLSASAPPILIEPPFQMDARFAYFRQDGPELPGTNQPGADTGLYRVRRDGGAPAEKLATVFPPRGWLVDGGYLYFYGQGTLERRPLQEGAQPEVLAHWTAGTVRGAFMPTIRLADGRAYFTRDDGIWSVPVQGGAPAIRHVAASVSKVIDLLVQGTCVYWADDRRINRARIGTDADAAPETLADESEYQWTRALTDSDPRMASDTVLDRRVLASDGRFLYWADAGDERIMRVAPAPQVRPVAPPPVAARAGATAVSDTPPPEGTPWEPSCRVHQACTQPAAALPACAADGAQGQPWSALEAKADALLGKQVDVRGPLQLGWILRGRGMRSAGGNNGVAMRVGCAPGTCCRSDPRPIVVGGGRDELRLDALACVGDDSRRCCNAPAFGQTVVTSGILARDGRHRWMLRSPRVCAASEPDGGR